jgi:nucleoid DNA-binding protein
MTKKSKKLQGEKYTKNFLIKEIGDRAGFTHEDARFMFNAFESIVEDIVAERERLMIGGLFSIEICEIEPHMAYDVNTKTEKHRDVSYRMTIKPSTTLKKILKDGKSKNENSSDGGSLIQEG